MNHYHLSVSLNDSQTRQRSSRAQRKRPMTPSDLTFQQLFDAMSAALSKKGKSPQVLSNHLSAMNAFMAEHGFNPESSIGSHLRASFYRRLREHVETLVLQSRTAEYISNRKNLLGHWRSLLLQIDKESAAISNTVSPFQAAIKHLLSKTDSIAKLSRDTGVSKSAIQRWATGTTPQKSSISQLRRLESFFGMPRNALVSLTNDTSDSTPLAPPLVESIEYRQRLSQSNQSPYRLKIISESFKEEWLDFFSYKTSLLSALERQSKGQWALTKHTTFIQTDKNWYCFIDNRYCPTAAINWTTLTMFCGWLSLSKSQGGAGLPIEAAQSLSCLLSVNHLINYVQWLAKRSEGTIHGGITSFVKFIKSTVHPITGYLTQSPQLAQALHSSLNLYGDWNELCSRTFEWSKKTLKQLTPRQKKSRDPFEPIKAVLELPNPMDAVSDMVQRMKVNRPSTGGLSEAIWARDLVLIKLLASNPLRAKNFKLLTYKRDNTGQLRQTPDGSWRIVIIPELFKNQTGAAKTRPYNMPIDESVWKDLEIYLKRYRPLLPHAQESDMVFLSGDGRANTNGWETLNRRVFHLTRLYLWKCKGAGPHAFRYINGTAILKALPGAWEVAAQVLHDREDTVRMHYAHLRGTDGAERAHAALKSSFSRM